MVGAHVDSVFRLKADARFGHSVPSSRTVGIGGCAFNVAAGLSALGYGTAHAGVRGVDADGDSVSRALLTHGVSDLGLTLRDVPTGCYTALLEPDGSVALATAAMEAYGAAERLLAEASFLEAAASARMLVVDANAHPDTITALAAARGQSTRLALLATSTNKARRLAPVLEQADLLFANADEWRELRPFHTRIRQAFVTSGAKGAVAYEFGDIVGKCAAERVAVEDVVGAGDAFSVAVIDGWLRGQSTDDILAGGVRLASRCVGHTGALGWVPHYDAERRLPA